MDLQCVLHIKRVEFSVSLSDNILPVLGFITVLNVYFQLRKQSLLSVTIVAFSYFSFVHCVSFFIWIIHVYVDHSNIVISCLVLSYKKKIKICESRTSECLKEIKIWVWQITQDLPKEFYASCVFQLFCGLFDTSNKVSFLSSTKWPASLR